MPDDNSNNNYSIEHGFDRLHTDVRTVGTQVESLRSSMERQIAALAVRIETKADLKATQRRLDALEEAERKLYRLALKIAVACGLAGGGASGLFQYFGTI